MADDRPFGYDTLKLRAVFIPQGNPNGVSAADITSHLGHDVVKLRAIFDPDDNPNNVTAADITDYLGHDVVKLRYAWRGSEGGRGSNWSRHKTTRAAAVLRRAADRPPARCEARMLPTSLRPVGCRPGPPCCRRRCRPRRLNMSIRQGLRSHGGTRSMCCRQPTQLPRRPASRLFRETRMARTQL